MRVRRRPSARPGVAKGKGRWAGGGSLLGLHGSTQRRAGIPARLADQREALPLTGARGWPPSKSDGWRQRSGRRLRRALSQVRLSTRTRVNAGVRPSTGPECCRCWPPEFAIGTVTGWPGFKAQCAPAHRARPPSFAARERLALHPRGQRVETLMHYNAYPLPCWRGTIGGIHPS